MKTLLRSPLVAAAVGGLTVAGALLALGVTGRREVRTVIVEAPLAGQRASDTASGLTPYEIFEHDSRGVVYVHADVSPDPQNPFTTPGGQSPGYSSGSGFVVDDLGDILTDYHLIQGASATGVTVGLDPGTSVPARIMGVEPSQDLAILRVDPTRIHLQPLALGNSTTARVGDPTLAIADPFGLDRTLTTGIVSALQRQIPSVGGFTIDHVIQTDAALGANTAGGPLIDAAGRVIGIDSEIQDASDADGPPVGFAVPIDTVTALLRRVGVHSASAYLGVDGVTVTGALARAGVGTRHGVLIESVDPAGPGARVGLRPGSVKRTVDGQTVYLGGDVIERVDGVTADSMHALSRLLATQRPGEAVRLSVLRDGKVEAVTVTLTAGPSGR